MAQLVYFIVYGGILFNIGVASRDIRLGLIIVIIGYKIFNRVFREKFAELTAKLCGKSFVVG